MTLDYPSDKAFLTLNVTYRCNLSCKYCWYDLDSPALSRSNDMSLETFKKVIDVFAISDYRQIEITFHGGEPLLWGLSNFQTAFEYLATVFNRAGKDYKLIIQTNGTLASESLGDLLEEYNCSLGISLDGPADIHDQNRSYRDGSGSLKQVLDNIQVWQSHGLPIGTVTVIHKHNWMKMALVYRFIRDLGIRHMHFIPFVPAGRGRKYRNEFAISAQQYCEAMLSLLNEWSYDTEDVYLLPIQEYIRTMFLRTPTYCVFFQGCPPNIYGVNPQGDLYPCIRFAESSGFVIGNVWRLSSLGDIRNSKARRALVERMERIKSTDSFCANCRYSHICGAGCAFEAFYGQGTLHKESMFCQGHMQVFDYISKFMSDIA